MAFKRFLLGSVFSLVIVGAVEAQTAPAPTLPLNSTADKITVNQSGVAKAASPLNILSNGPYTNHTFYNPNAVQTRTNRILLGGAAPNDGNTPFTNLDVLGPYVGTTGPTIIGDQLNYSFLGIATDPASNPCITATPCTGITSYGLTSGAPVGSSVEGAVFGILNKPTGGINVPGWAEYIDAQQLAADTDTTYGVENEMRNAGNATPPTTETPYSWTAQTVNEELACGGGYSSPFTVYNCGDAMYIATNGGHYMVGINFRDGALAQAGAVDTNILQAIQLPQNGGIIGYTSSGKHGTDFIDASGNWNINPATGQVVETNAGFVVPVTTGAYYFGVSLDSFLSGTNTSIQGEVNLTPAFTLNSSGLLLNSLASAGTQCLQASTLGLISGTGTACGAGGGGVTSISATSPLTGGTITSTGSIGLPTSLGGAASFTAHGLLVGEGASSLALVGPNATAGAFLLGAGASADPAYSTAATLTASGLAMSGATGGAQGAGSINAQSFYQNGSQVNVLNFLTACPSCSFTLPGVNDTLIGLASTPVLANLWTFNANIQLSDGGNITGTSNPADEFLKINGNITAGQGYLAALVAGANGHGSSSGYALLSLGGNSLGGITNASGVVGGATYDQQIFASGTAGYYGYRVNPTVSSAGSGIEDAYDIYHGATRWSAWDYRGLFAPHVFTVSTLPTTGPVPDTGARATISDQLTTCAAIGVAPTGGGSVVCPVMWNGSAWISG